MSNEVASSKTNNAKWAANLIHARRTVLPKRLTGPGPDQAELETILGAASAAPDHGQLLPWRFLLIPTGQRATLAELFSQALLERDASASIDQQAQAREKAFRAPTLLLLIVDGARGDPEVDMAERLISAGCAVQNVLLMATAMGFASALTSGKALKSQALRQRLSLSAEEHALCFISLGRAASQRVPRPRPTVADYFSVMGEEPNAS